MEEGETIDGCCRGLLYLCTPTLKIWYSAKQDESSCLLAVERIYCIDGQEQRKCVCLLCLELVIPAL